MLVFLTAAMAIGKVGAATGLNDWLAVTLLPDQLPENIFVLAVFIGAIAIVIHMFIGSVMLNGSGGPRILVCTNALGIESFCNCSHYLSGGLYPLYHAIPSFEYFSGAR